MQQLKLSQIPKGNKFLFSECLFTVLEVQKDGIFVRRSLDNHVFTLPANTEVEASKSIINSIKSVK